MQQEAQLRIAQCVSITVTELSRQPGNVQARDSLVKSAGIPTLVARRMLKGSAQIVARIVGSAEEARAAAAEGANLAILQVGICHHSPLPSAWPSSVPFMSCLN